MLLGGRPVNRQQRPRVLEARASAQLIPSSGSTSSRRSGGLLPREPTPRLSPDAYALDRRHRCAGTGVAVGIHQLSGGYHIFPRSFRSRCRRRIQVLEVGLDHGARDIARFLKFALGRVPQRAATLAAMPALPEGLIVAQPAEARPGRGADGKCRACCAVASKPWAKRVANLVEMHQLVVWVADGGIMASKHRRKRWVGRPVSADQGSQAGFPVDPVPLGVGEDVSVLVGPLKIDIAAGHHKNASVELDRDIPHSIRADTRRVRPRQRIWPVGQKLHAEEAVIQVIVQRLADGRISVKNVGGHSRFDLAVSYGYGGFPVGKFQRLFEIVLRRETPLDRHDLSHAADDFLSGYPGRPSPVGPGEQPARGRAARSLLAFARWAGRRTGSVRLPHRGLRVRRGISLRHITPGIGAPVVDVATVLGTRAFAFVSHGILQVDVTTICIGAARGAPQYVVH